MRKEVARRATDVHSLEVHDAIRYGLAWLKLCSRFLEV
jgi:hypothetical protein